MVVKVLDMGFITAFDRPFNPIYDSSYVGIGIETLRDAIGRSSANLAVAAIARAPRRAARRSRSWRCCASRGSPPATATGRSGGPWCSASSGWRCALVGAPVASTSAAALAVDEVQAVQSGLATHAILAREIRRDRFHDTPGDQLLTGLRGKDVLLLFVESYGQVAVQGSSFSPGIDAVLDRAPRSSGAPASPRAAGS